MASVLPSSMTGLAATPAASNQSSTSRRVRAPGSNSTSGSRANACGVAAAGMDAGSRAGKIATNSSSSTGVTSNMRPGAGSVTSPMSSVLFSSPAQRVRPVLAAAGDVQRREAAPYRQPAAAAFRQVHAVAPGAQPDAAGYLRGVRGHGELGLRQRGVDDPHVLQQFQPGRGRPGPAADAFHQLQAEAPFQLADLQADGGLGHPAPFRRSGKAAQFDHLRKGAQMVQV